MKNTTHPKEHAVAGAIAPTARLTPYALFLISTVLSAFVALPLWMIELLF